MNSGVLGDLPPTSFAFAYGSAVFRQASYGEEQFKNAMLDLIIAVDDPLAWHRENISRNRSHYSFLASLGPKVVAHVQQNWGARIFYNPFVKIGQRVQNIDGMQAHFVQEAKYGVISTAHLLKDLTEWETFYVSGRMHKPVLVLQPNDTVAKAATENCASALRTALLMLPEGFSTVELYEAIVGLSYLGDPRMMIGENKNKMRNIVSAGRLQFDELYAQPLRQLEPWLQRSGDAWKQDITPAAIRANIERLPIGLRSRMPQVHSHAQSRSVVQKAVRAIVRRSSTSQSLKGVLSAGVRRTVRYSAAKLAKMW